MCICIWIYYVNIEYNCCAGIDFAETIKDLGTNKFRMDDVISIITNEAPVREQVEDASFPYEFAAITTRRIFSFVVAF